jgi:hypothetical protein
MTVTIAAIGTHGTGKTTTIHELTYNLKMGKTTGYKFIDKLIKDMNKEPSIKVLTEVASDCPLPINEISTLDSQLWMFANQVKEEMEYRNSKYDFLLIDRSVFDYISYTINLENSLKINHDVSRGMIKIASVIPYNLLIYHKIIDGFLKEDGIRSVNSDFQIRIDNILTEVLTCFSDTTTIVNKE